jgi:2,4-dienoyl-CoA reductase-like NADH-dependent reductase (Old Yellow Enzyme family)
LTEWELDALILGLKRQKRDSWERCRLLGFWQLSSMGAKIKSPQELLKFTWEDAEVIDEEEVPEELTKEQIQALKEEFRKSFKT